MEEEEMREKGIGKAMKKKEKKGDSYVKGEEKE